jgi:hypothetical protein
VVEGIVVTIMILRLVLLSFRRLQSQRHGDVAVAGVAVVNFAAADAVNAADFLLLAAAAIVTMMVPVTAAAAAHVWHVAEEMLVVVVVVVAVVLGRRRTWKHSS